MTISGITSNASTATIGLISGTGTVQTSTLSDVLSQSSSTDQANISQGAQTMNKLKTLSTTDPTKFKEAAQKISDELTEKANSTTDAEDKKHLTEMASQFSEAAQTGSMDSLKPPTPPSGANASQNGKALSKFSSNKDHSSMMSSIDSIINNAISSVSTSSSSTSSTSTVESSSETAA